MTTEGTLDEEFVFRVTAMRGGRVARSMLYAQRRSADARAARWSMSDLYDEVLVSRLRVVDDY